MPRKKTPKHINSFGESVHEVIAQNRARRVQKLLGSRVRQVQKSVAKPTGMGAAALKKAARAEWEHQKLRTQQGMEMMRCGAPAGSKEQVAAAKWIKQMLGQGGIGLHDIPIWVCFGPDLRPRAVYLERPTRAEHMAHICDEVQAGKESKASDNATAKRMGYFVVEMLAWRPFRGQPRPGPAPIRPAGRTAVSSFVHLWSKPGAPARITEP